MMTKHVLHFAIAPGGVYNKKYHAIIPVFLNSYCRFFEEVKTRKKYYNLTEQYKYQAALADINKKLESIISSIDQFDFDKDGMPIERHLDMMYKNWQMFSDIYSVNPPTAIWDDQFRIRKVPKVTYHKDRSAQEQFYTQLAANYTHSQVLDWIYEVAPYLYARIIVAANSHLIDFICDEANKARATDVVISSVGDRPSYARDLKARRREGTGLFIADLEIIQQALSRKLTANVNVKRNDFLLADVMLGKPGESTARGKRSYRNKLAGRKDSLVHEDIGFSSDVISYYAVSHQSCTSYLTDQEIAAGGIFTSYVIHHLPERELYPQIKNHLYLFPSINHHIYKYDGSSRPVVDFSLVGEGVTNKSYAGNLLTIMSCHAQTYTDTIDVEVFFQQLANLRYMNALGSITAMPQESASAGKEIVILRSAVQQNSVFKPFPDTKAGAPLAIDVLDEHHVGAAPEKSGICR